MKTIITDLGEYKPEYPIELLADPANVLFMDIETTGLTPANTNLYLIGCAYFENDEWHVIQWFAERYEEELTLLTAFFDFVKKYKYLIHFNGNKFDIPYLQYKCDQFSLEGNFDSFTGIDIYKRIASLKNILGLPNMKQKTIEEFLGLNREDKYTGRELISIYHDYVCDHDDKYFNDLMLHNEDDIKGMFKVVSMLAYNDLFKQPVRVMKAQANYFNNMDKKRCQEIIMKLKLASPLPVPVSFRGNGCYFTGQGIDGQLKVPLYEEELKYFYSNYKNYYYLPAEDIAMHKSVATFVDKAHRVNANAANCYTRKKSLYLQQWDVVFEPFFKRDYKDKELFFEVTDEFKKDREGFSKYASHTLNAMLRDSMTY